MSTNVSIDSIADAMVTQLAAQLAPATGQSVSSLRPVRTVQRYMGNELTNPEAFKRGVAGRCPAIRVRPVGTRKISTTIGRRVDRVESTFSVYVISDSQRGKDDRKSVLPLVESVRKYVGSHSFGLAVNPMRYQRTEVIRDDDQAL